MNHNVIEAYENDFVQQSPAHVHVFAPDDTLETPIDMGDVTYDDEHLRAESAEFLHDQVLVFAASAMGTVMLGVGFLFFGGFGAF